ncbi:MAG: hypothetical protein ACRBEE_00930 [Arenicella sp.]
MAIFLIFASIVLLSLSIQWLTKRWFFATGLPCCIYLLLIGTGVLFPNRVLPALTLGLPMIFFAALLGSYIYETRINPSRFNDPTDTHRQ